MANPSALSTADLILDVAERRAQSVGFGGFSYADIADELRVTTATIHYHFSAKSDLGGTLIERYTERFLAALAQIAACKPRPGAQLRAYAQIYESVLSEGRLCLCGILAAEYETLPEAMRERIVAFFAANEAWLAAVLTRGREQGAFAFEGDARDGAMALMGGLEGAMLVSRAYGGVVRFRAATQLMLANIVSPSAA